MAEEFRLFTSLRYDAALLEIPSRGLSHAGWNSHNKSPLYMLDYHRDRMLMAAVHWKWQDAVEILSGDAGLEVLAELVLQTVGSNQRSPLRVKIVVSKEGVLGCETSATPVTRIANLFPLVLPQINKSSPEDGGLLPSREPIYEVTIDAVSTPVSEYTHFKTTRRAMYDSARQRAGISPTDHKEALLVNDLDGSIMEGTLTTPYFWRNGRWVTPPISSQYGCRMDSGGQDGTTRRWVIERGVVFGENVKADSLVDGEECWLSNGVRGFIWGRIKL